MFSSSRARFVVPGTAASNGCVPRREASSQTHSDHFCSRVKGAARRVDRAPAPGTSLTGFSSGPREGGDGSLPLAQVLLQDLELLLLLLLLLPWLPAQPGGFEGVGRVREETRVGHPFVPHDPDQAKRDIELDPARSSPCSEAAESDHLLSGVPNLLYLEAHPIPLLG